MRVLSGFVLSCLLSLGLFAAVEEQPQDTIRGVLMQQVAAWNRGDLRQFAESYAEHCILVGSTISETTREQVLTHYRQKYPSPGSRGKLTFSNLTVHQMDARIAAVTGRWHLAREAASGGAVGGVFSLVFELHAGKWQIALDHTS